MEALETPVPVIDLDIVEANLRRMQDYCDAQGLALRPHIKTHKIPALAQRQMALGAVGITCQKLGEAEVMVAAGLRDIFISYPLVGAAKAARLAALSSQARMRVAIDNPMALATLSEAARGGGEIGVLVEFDSGNARTGVTSVEAALELARAVARAEGLRFDGLMTYPVTDKTQPFLDAILPRLAAEGLKPAVISGGGTPRSFETHRIAPGITELRVGTYIYNDRMQVAAGHARWEDCALKLHVTCISRPTEDRGIVDAGSKSFAADPMPGAAGQGHAYFPAYPEAKLDRISEEHGMMDLSASAAKPAIGEVLQAIPNHVCPVSNLHDKVAFVKGGVFQGFTEVAARGRTL